MGVLVGCGARHRSRSMVIPFKRPATQHRAHPCSQNVLVIHGQSLNDAESMQRFAAVFVHAAKYDFESGS